MKDWHVYVAIGILSFLLVDLVLMPDGSIVVRIVRIVVEMLMRIG